MDAKGEVKNIQKSYKKVPCTTKALNENNLANFEKDQLIKFILENKEKLLVDEQKHRKAYIKKPKKQLNFDDQP